MVIRNHSTVLFQGDSVTDTGRFEHNDLGRGYPMFVESWFSAQHVGMNVRFMNRGVSGNRSEDVLKRWKEDCVDLKPDLVSILIGINDCWRRYDSDLITTAEQYYVNCKKMISRTKEETDAEIVLMEPFLLPFTEEQKTWREDLNPKIDALRELAGEYRLTLIPLDGIFNSVSALKEPGFWTQDGVHPTNEGHALIAREWLKAMEEL